MGNKDLDKTIAQMEEYIAQHRVAGDFELRAWVRNLKKMQENNG